MKWWDYILEYLWVPFMSIIAYNYHRWVSRFDALEKDMQKHKESLANFQLVVAQNYATQNQIKEVDDKVTALSDKLDDHNTATTARLDQIYNILVSRK